MARPSPVLVLRSVGSASRSVANYLKGPASASRLKSPTSAPAPSALPSIVSRQPSCPISRFRSAIVSLQPLHSVSSQSLFVSMLSFGSRDPTFLVQGQPLCALTVL